MLILLYLSKYFSEQSPKFPAPREQPGILRPGYPNGAERRRAPCRKGPRSAGLQPSVFERENAVEAANEVEERIEHALAGRVIEVARWLVAEQEVGVIGEGADDRDPLLLATRQTGRPMLRTRGKTDLVEECGSLRSCR